MLSNIGAFFSIWLILWLILSVVFVLLYPLLRPSLFRLHPRYSSALVLCYWLTPLLGSLTSALFLFTPIVEVFLVDSHCHVACESHAPQIGSKGLAWFGVTVGLCVLVYLMIRLTSIVTSAYRLNGQFSRLANFRGDYFSISSLNPLVFTLGWWNPKIFISDGLVSSCSEEDLSIVIMHEEGHKLRRDNLRLLLARLSTALLTEPLARKVIADIQLLTEQACDFYAAEKYGHIAVAETLLKVKRLLMEDSKLSLQGATAFADNSVEQRILVLISDEQKLALRPWQLAVLVTLGLSLLFASIGPLHHGSEWVIAFLTAGH
ncbi:MAG: M56 family metallopeptidase [Pseudohongiellaceae bacterium]|nr:M56 family metallopeptidase [Pseudohongiellaceae bacterium]